MGKAKINGDACCGYSQEMLIQCAATNKQYRKTKEMSYTTWRTANFTHKKAGKNFNSVDVDKLVIYLHCSNQKSI